MDEKELLAKVKKYKDLKNKISILDAEVKELNKELKDENTFLYSKYISTVNEERLQVTGGDIV